VVKKDGGGILYNSLTGARASISPGILTKEQILALGGNIDLLLREPSDDKVLSILRQYQFLIPHDFDEFDYLKMRFNMYAHNPDVRRITVILTRNCNLNCNYCYQDKTVGAEKIINKERVLKFIKMQIVPNGLLQVTWFGGEPLLKIKLICQLSDVIIPICKDVGTSYMATISTNGVLLDKEKINLLMRKGVGIFQITLDGPSRVQEIRRPALNKKPTYEIIVDNIKRLVDAGAEVRIKVIIDRFNYQTIPELFQDLKRRSILGFVKIAIQQTEAKFSAENYQGRFNCLEEFARIKMWLLKCLVEEGYKIPEPSQAPEFCAATSPFCNVVDMTGNMYRCGTESVNKTGYISISGKPVLINTSYDQMFTKQKFASMKMCRICKVLPICGGGCTLAANELAKRDVCSFYKVIIRDYLVLLERQDKRIKKSCGM